MPGRWPRVNKHAQARKHLPGWTPDKAVLSHSLPYSALFSHSQHQSTALSKLKITRKTAGEGKKKEWGRKLPDRSNKIPFPLLNWYLFSQAIPSTLKVPKLKQNLKKEKCTCASYKHTDMQKSWSWKADFWMSGNLVKIRLTQHPLHKRSQNIKQSQRTFILPILIFLFISSGLDYVSSGIIGSGGW